MKSFFSQNSEKKLWKIFILLFVFFFFPLSVSADEYWSEEIELSAGLAKYSEKDFDSFALKIPAGTRVEYLDNNKWNLLNIDDEYEVDSEWSELISWKRGRSLILRFGGNIPEKISGDFYRINQMTRNNDLLDKNITASTKYVGNVRIYSRAEWGAEESWRYNSQAHDKNVEEKETGKASVTTRAKKCQDAAKIYPDEFEVGETINKENGKFLIWPFQYSKKIRKVIIHHTAETGVTKGLTPEQVMRSIYRYHTVSRGWGDIGYHYVVAPNGNIYEGKAGGDYVVGGHVFCNNVGTIGVSLMGNFETGNPTEAQIRALKKLLPQLSKKYEIDLTTEEEYRGEVTPNLLGHRDLGATACPGKNMHALLPSFRKFLEGSSATIHAQNQKADGEFTQKLNVLTLEPGQKKTLSLAFKNTGKVPWDSRTWLFANAGDGISVRSVATGKKYVAAKMKESFVDLGEVAHFSVDIEAGFEGGLYTISFVPVVREKRVVNAEILQVFEISDPSWGAQFSEIRTQPKVPVLGKPISFSIDMKNTGDSKWDADQTSVALKIFETDTALLLDLKQDTFPGKIGTFNGRLPEFETAGEKTLRFQFLLNNEPVPAQITKTLLIAEGINRGRIVDFDEKFLVGNIGSLFHKEIKILNTGNEEWDSDGLKLEIVNRRQRTVLWPKDNVVAPGESATFDLNFSVKEGLQPYLIFVKDGLQILDKKTFLFRGIEGGEEIISFDDLGKEPKKSFVSETKSSFSSSESCKQGSEPPCYTNSQKLIRIKLSFPMDKEEFFLSANGDFDIFNKNGKLLSSIRATQNISAKKIGNLMKIGNEFSREIRFIPKSSKTLFEILNWERYPAWDGQKKWNDNLFSGVLELRILDGNLTVINELPLETYLQGIGETIESEHAEKKKAIAVVARSYAEFYIDPKNKKFPGKPYDGSDDPREFQKYLGARFMQRAPLWVEAAVQTSGEVLTYNEKLIKTPFHSCSGGVTSSAKEIWGWTHTPYLKAVEDPGGEGKWRSGHGVGLSGCGAQYFAEKGKTYEEILEYYYEGIEIRK